MWIVRLALRRPYTFVVAAMLVAILGVVEISRMPTDIFPEIDIPVISIIFNYGGMAAPDLEKRICGQFERFLTTTVNDIEHIESQSLNGIGVIKCFFQPGAKIEAATAQITAVSQTAIRSMPPGTFPPLIIRYNASSVPVLQLAIGSDVLPEQQLFDLTVNALRPQLITIPGVQIPYPYGGKQRQIMVDLDLQRLFAHGLSPADVSTALGSQNLILPAGSAKIGSQEYQVTLNSSPDTVAALNDLPVQTINGATVTIKDIAHVRDGFSVQTNLVHAEGKAGVLLPVYKSGSASTLAVVDAVKSALPRIRNMLPPALKVTPIVDQSIFVRASVDGVIREAAIAAGLTGLMILLFLGSWRSTVIVMISIPLSILVSIIVLSFLGQTLNVMTLGGMALAVGILVDDATVEIENIHRNLHQHKRLVQAILDGASQIAVPAFVSTLCICIVFVPVVFISGPARYLFTPLAMAVVFAMMTSYLLSRTLVPTMVHYLLAAEVEMYGGVLNGEGTSGPRGPAQSAAGRGWRAGALALGALAVVLALGGALAPEGGTLAAARDAVLAPVRHALADPGAALRMSMGGAVVLCLAAAAWIGSRLGLFWAIHKGFESAFERFRRVYGGYLAYALDRPHAVSVLFVVVTALSCLLMPLVGEDFFPSVDAGQMRMHVRCPAGTRIEETAHQFADVERAIRKLIPPREVEAILDDIGIPYSGINLSLSDGSMISPADGEILVSLAREHSPIEQTMRRVRLSLREQFPDLTIWFAPADIVTQVLNFGLPAPIDVQVSGPMFNLAKNEAIARRMLAEAVRIPGVVDARLQQVPHAPDIRVNVDRTLASQMGVAQKDVASDLLISLSSSNQTAPNFWLNPQNAVNYSIYVQTPQYRMDSVDALGRTPVSPIGVPAAAGATQLLANLATTGRGASPTNATHFNILPTFDCLLGVQGADLGSVAARIEAMVARYRRELPRGSQIELHGQVESMHASYSGLGMGLGFAVILVYLLMVINFQSWIDPFIILMALPGALAGILWMLWVSSTTISVPALMGAMMSIGVATSNSILMITFANDQREEGLDARAAALAAGITRVRPVLMTALAMILGMLPMSLGLGEGGEQNAPLGRAVIGGLLMATFATLFFVPAVYSLLRRQPPRVETDPLLAE